MSSNNLSRKEESIKNLIIGGCHLGGKRVTKQMKSYVFKVKNDGVCIFDVNKIYEKIQVAARIIASIPDSTTVISCSGRQIGQRGVYKFSQYTNSTGITGRWTPGMLTNQITKKFIEPRLLIVCDPRLDYNAIVESSYVNIPVIAICNTDNNLKYVDCAIPCNNRSPKSLAMIYWMLTREVLYFKGELENKEFDCLPGAFMYRNVDKEEQDKKKEEENKQEQNEEDIKEGEGEAEENEGEEHFLEH